MTVKTPQERFDHIYKREIWGRGKGSGDGSSPVYSAEYLKILRQELDRIPGGRVLDIGCGDWQLYRDFSWDNHHYLGVDVVLQDSAVASARPRVSFMQCDVTAPGELRARLIGISPDIVLVKDVMQHMSEEELENLCSELMLMSWKTLIVVNDHRYSRDPSKNGTPRSVANRYSWAPVDICHPRLVALGLEPVAYYPRNRRKCVMLARRGA